MAKSAQQKASQKQEKSIAKLCGGRVQVASGALDGAKGDVRNGKFLIECKTTTTNRYRLSKKTWDKIEREALKDGLRIPIMQIDIAGESCLIMDFDVYLDFFRADEKFYQIWEWEKFTDEGITIKKSTILTMKDEDFAAIQFVAFKRKYAIMLLSKFADKLKGEC